jgi:hypothetical protein
MREDTKLKILFVVFAIGAALFVIASNPGITGNVVAEEKNINLISPVDTARTNNHEMDFIFSYDYEIDMQTCSLIINDEEKKSLNALLRPNRNKISYELSAGEYNWMIACKDSEEKIYDSIQRKFTITGLLEEKDYEKTKFKDRAGYLYKLLIREDTALEVSGVVPNDVLELVIGENTYEIQILRINQDYERGVEYTEVLVIPGNKRLKIYEQEKVDLDLNNDNIIDAVVGLESITYNKATFIVESYKEQEPVVLIAKEVEQETQEPEEQTPANSFSEEINNIENDANNQMIFLAVILLILFAVVLAANSRKRKELDVLVGLKKDYILRKKSKGKVNLRKLMGLEKEEKPKTKKATKKSSKRKKKKTAKKKSKTTKKKPKTKKVSAKKRTSKKVAKKTKKKSSKKTTGKKTANTKKKKSSAKAVKKTSKKTTKKTVKKKTSGVNKSKKTTNAKKKTSGKKSVKKTAKKTSKKKTSKKSSKKKSKKSKK